MRVPDALRIGEEGMGFIHMMERLVQERVGAAVSNTAHAAQILDETIEYVKQRTAFGQAVGSFQHNKFKVAEPADDDRRHAGVRRPVRARARPRRACRRRTPRRRSGGARRCRTTSSTSACRLYGGYGYMNEYRVARAWRDARVTKIWAGSNEIMKEAHRPGPRAVRGLQGKVALVTGASRGIGFAAAERLVAEGARVAITARKAEPLAAAVEALGGPDVAIGVAGRADDAAHRDEVLARVTEAFGPLDLLVNNTGINPAYGPLADLDLDVARKITETNVVSTLAWTQASLRAGLADGGAVVNVSSIAGLQPAPGIAFYGVTKAALIQAHRVAGDRARPGRAGQRGGPGGGEDPVRAGALRARRGGCRQPLPAAAPRPAGRRGRGHRVPAVGRREWITGQTLVLDGGITRSGGLG
ncbi:hypothetical protein GCM10025868_10550 [Angustibacter aerolatus]|uniref:Acyl-CoA dehydrogenase/oxidase C-terminal domain-containing protein n=1 Tax=Angustibacter aerolatus TaxID=1162965 RepID=A0ABQ6JF44_9ACTN|nr:hypothetical protein GCM10025868_10550 [Angustibacter aerolatus]